MNRVRYFFFGAVTGAAAGYLLDPNSGRRRRAVLRDKTNKFIRQTGEGIEVGVRDLKHRVQGMAAEIKHRFSRAQTPTAEKLRARVSTQLGRTVSHPHEVHVTVKGTDVILTGRVPADEVSELLACVQSVEGVGHVSNQLDLFDDAYEPEVGRTSRARRSRNLPPAARLIAAGVGGTLLARGIARGGLRGALGILGGMAATSCAMSKHAQQAQTPHMEHPPQPPSVPEPVPTEEAQPIEATPLVPAMD